MPFRLRMPAALWTIVAMVTSVLAAGPSAQAPRILVAALAHADDEGPIAPVLARHAREGAQVYMMVVSDGSGGRRAGAHSTTRWHAHWRGARHSSRGRGAVCGTSAGHTTADPSWFPGRQAR